MATIVEREAVAPTSGWQMATASLRFQQFRWVYASNRAIDNIVQMGIDPESGTVRPLGWTSSGGKTIRNFNLDPSGKFLIAAHQDGASLVPFSIDAETGALTPTGQVVAVDSPICVVFAPGVGVG